MEKMRFVVVFLDAQTNDSPKTIDWISISKD